jgi:hypothetical protein
MTDIARYNAYHAHFHRQAPLTAEQFNARFQTTLKPIPALALRRFQSAMRGTRPDIAACLQEACSTCGDTHVGECGDTHVGGDTCVSSLLQGMAAPEVDVREQVTFGDVFCAYAQNVLREMIEDKVENPLQETQDLLSGLCIVQKDPPLGLDLENVVQVCDYIDNHAFPREQLHHDTIHFLDETSENGEVVRKRVDIDESRVQNMLRPLMLPATQ